jgi:hypothetical protein
MLTVPTFDLRQCFLRCNAMPVRAVRDACVHYHGTCVAMPMPDNVQNAVQCMRDAMPYLCDAPVRAGDRCSAMR